MSDTSGVDRQPGPDKMARIAVLREAFALTARTILRECPASRQQSVALTALETAEMWAAKAVICTDMQSAGKEPTT